MKGYYSGNSLEGIESVIQDGGKLSLLARGGATEVMVSHIYAGKLFSVYPAEDEDTLEFFYILDGEVENRANHELLKKGDYFYMKALQETMSFEARCDVLLLYVSSQPLFHYLSDVIKEMNEIVRKVEDKDIYTRNHGSRVQNLGVKIARKLALPPEKIDTIAYAGMFHDIGKIHVPDAILLKPGRLTPEETEYIKRHPVDGRKMVQGTQLESLGDIIAQHHERLDGSGYPYGLVGDRILFEARIVAVADVYDAMTTDRPYKKGLEAAEALDELKKNAGSSYDADVVKALGAVLKDEGIL